MRWLIVLLVSVLVASDLLGLGLSLGPGLSVKNAILYSLAVALVARMVLIDGLRIEMPAVLVGFAILIGYAIFSWLAASFVIRYPRYDLIDSAIKLKAFLIDPALFFFSAFYALRTSTDVRVVLKAFAVAFTAANLFTITDVVGLTDFGVRIGERGAEAGRVFGVFGHANETAGLIVCLLPGVAALAASSRGPAKIAWGLAALVSLSVLVMTVSRGAFVAAALGTVWAMFVCRRYVPVGLLMRGGVLAGVSVVAVLVVVSILEPSIGSVIEDRLFAQSSARDIDDLSSGRTAIWSAAVGRMMDSPLTLLTGFGWDMYAYMPFKLATHNYYLSLWFELGIPGLAAMLFILATVISTALRAVEAQSAELRPYLLGYLFGMFPFAIALFFGDMANPWPYIWIYTGIAMRAAVLTLESGKQTAPAKRSAQAAPISPVRLHRRST